MIYALKPGRVPQHIRAKIAQAIRDHHELSDPELLSVLVHVKNATAGVPYECIYCRDGVRPARFAHPVDRPAADNWYFMHKSNSRCLGTDAGLGAGLFNPVGQGCYLQMGCEHQEDGSPAIWSRRNCKAILSEQTYCHLARKLGCLDAQ